MESSFIFYGTLTNSTLLLKICGTLPRDVRAGFIKGRLYKVTDQKEPNGIYSYPLAILCDKGHLISATFNTFETSEQEFKIIQSKLTEFEGALYEQVETDFHDSTHTKRKGLIFVAKRDIDITSLPNVRQIHAVDNVCSWQPNACL